MRFFELTKLLEESAISTEEISEYLKLTILFGKMIGQNYLLYLELNEESRAALRDMDENELGRPSRTIAF